MTTILLFRSISSEYQAIWLKFNMNIEISGKDCVSHGIRLLCPYDAIITGAISLQQQTESQMK